MAKVHLAHVERFKDRHGKIRYYYRIGKGDRIPLPAPGDPQFLRAYREAEESYRKPAKGHASLDPPKSLNALMRSYFQSSDFMMLKGSTKAKYRISCDWLSRHYGQLPADRMRRQDVIRIRDRKSADGPAAANSLLKAIKNLIRHGFDLGWIVQDPTEKIRKLREGEYHTWTNAEISKFEARWPAGTRERLAFALALYTGQRRADLAAMRWADVDLQAKTLEVAQEKTGTKLVIPVHTELWDILATMPRGADTIVSTMRSTRMTTESFGNWMADSIGAAGLPNRCVLHGLRKAAARRLAEAGCSASEIASITGHRTLSEVQRYTAAADQQTLATQAVEKLGRRRN